LVTDDEVELRGPVEMVFRLLFRATFEGATVPRPGTGVTVLRTEEGVELKRPEELPRV
jgi:hypothetical protein